MDVRPPMRKTKIESIEPRSSRTVFVGGIPLDIRVKELQEYLSTFDTVVKLQLPKNRKTGALKGYAKAIFASVAGVERAVAKQSHSLKNLKIGIFKWQDQETYMSKRDELIERKVHVRLPGEVTADQLHAYFSRYPGLEDIIMKRHPVTKRPRNFCYIVYTTKEEAQSVVDQSPHTVNNLQLQCSISVLPKKNEIEPDKKISKGTDDQSQKAINPQNLAFSLSKEKDRTSINAGNNVLSKVQNSCGVLSTNPNVHHNYKIEKHSEITMAFTKPTNLQYFTVRLGSTDYVKSQLDYSRNHMIRVIAKQMHL